MRGPVRGMERGPPRSVCDRFLGWGGWIPLTARGPVRPPQLHSPKDGPDYDYVKIHFNMAVKMQTFSGSYNFIKIKQNKTINVYFQLQEPSSICESEFKAYRLPYTRHSIFWDFYPETFI